LAEPGASSLTPMPADLRSDTVTRPTPAMREAMAQAPVGDDVYGEDPTVNALEQRAAELCGREAALFVPSGTMANQIAVGLWAGRGDEVYAHRDSHLLIDEAGGVAALWGAQTRGLHSPGQSLDLGELRDAVPMDASDIHRARARLLAIENTHVGSGGRVWSAESLARVTEGAHALGLRVHMDGARLPNAAVARGCTLAEASAGCDSVQFCLSKGLGAPVGSIVVSSAEAIQRGRRLRKVLGGGMRQAGIIAAAGLYALQHHLPRLAEDHARARVLAEELALCPRVSIDLASVESNIVLVRVARDEPAERVVDDLAAAGVLCGAYDRRTVRFVTHLDFDDEALEAARAAFGRVLI
jgi:threonine aldolase